MMLKKLAQNDTTALQLSKTTFGECLCSLLDEETVNMIFFNYYIKLILFFAAKKMVGSKSQLLFVGSNLGK